MNNQFFPGSRQKLSDTKDFKKSHHKRQRLDIVEDTKII